MQPKSFLFKRSWGIIREILSEISHPLFVAARKIHVCKSCVINIEDQYPTLGIKFNVGWLKAVCNQAGRSIFIRCIVCNYFIVAGNKITHFKRILPYMSLLKVKDVNFVRFKELFYLNLFSEGQESRKRSPALSLRLPTLQKKVFSLHYW